MLDRRPSRGSGNAEKLKAHASIGRHRHGLLGISVLFRCRHHAACKGLAIAAVAAVAAALRIKKATLRLISHESQGSVRESVSRFEKGGYRTIFKDLVDGAC